MRLAGATGGRRLWGFLAAGAVDSFAMAYGWTAFVLTAVALHGLRVAAAFNVAMLVGVALSAPATRRLEALLGGRALLRSTALVEAAFRVAVFVGLFAGAPLVLLLAAVVLMNVAGWSGFAAMRAEAAGHSRSAVALTWYAVGIGAVEAAGAATAALLVPSGGVLSGPARTGVVVVYAGSLLPTYLVAHYALRPRLRVAAESALRAARDLWRPLAGGAAVMALGSGLTLLAVPLAATLYGPRAVAASAAAFGLGAVLAPLSAAALQRARAHAALVWPLLGALMAIGWCAAPSALAGLVVAQLLSGFALAAFEGAMDARVAAAGGAVTSGLAYASATRALGSAPAVALIPLVASAGGVAPVAALQAGVLVLAAAGAVVLRLRRRQVGAVAELA